MKQKFRSSSSGKIPLVVASRFRMYLRPFHSARSLDILSLPKQARASFCRFERATRKLLFYFCKLIWFRLRPQVLCIVATPAIDYNVCSGQPGKSKLIYATHFCHRPNSQRGDRHNRSENEERPVLSGLRSHTGVRPLASS